MIRQNQYGVGRWGKRIRVAEKMESTALCYSYASNVRETNILTFSIESGPWCRGIEDFLARSIDLFKSTLKSVIHVRELKTKVQADLFASYVRAGDGTADKRIYLGIPKFIGTDGEISEYYNALATEILNEQRRSNYPGSTLYDEIIIVMTVYVKEFQP